MSFPSSSAEPAGPSTMAPLYTYADDLPPPYEAESPSESFNSNSNSCPSIMSSLSLEMGSPEYAPPAFSTIPITLHLLPGATSITPAIGTSGPLYELSQPLDGHVRRVSLTRSQDQQQIYRIYEAAQVPRDPDHTAIAGLLPDKKAQYQGTILQCRSKGTIWEATAHGEKWLARGDVVCSARYSWKSSQARNLEWRNAKGKLVARDYVVGDGQRGVDAERLEISEGARGKILDIVVAAWCARIFQDTQKEAARAEEAEKKRRRSSGREEGRQRGLGRRLTDLLQ